MPETDAQDPVIHIDPLKVLPHREWSVCKPLLQALNQRGLPYCVGGGLVIIMYGGHARATKDLDLFIDPRDSEAVIEILLEHGFGDLYPQQRYRRDWLYRGIKEDVILDVIWSMANRRADVDWSWFKHARRAEIEGVELPLMAPEELAWSKLYVMHRDRCDWPDLLNLLNMQAASMDWDRVLARTGEDWMLLASLLTVFRWLCPRASQAVPEEILRKLKLTDLYAQPVEGDEGSRASLLDSYRDWFGPLKPEEIVQRRMG